MEETRRQERHDDFISLVEEIRATVRDISRYRQFQPIQRYEDSIIDGRRRDRLLHPPIDSDNGMCVY